MDPADFAYPDGLTPRTLLVVDDDATLSATLRYNLQREGYIVLLAENGPDAVRVALAERPDLVILDIMLPGMNGFDVCQAIRAKLSVPILMLSAREAEIDKVLALELGADDYMSKPFGLPELLARVRAQLRRAELSKPIAHASTRGESTTGNQSASPHTSATEHDGLAPRHVLVSDSLNIDVDARTVTLSGRRIEMKRKEFDLLAFLASHPAKVFSREELLEAVWGYGYSGGTRTVDVHVRWLREKLESDPAEPLYIQTMHRAGYKFGKPVSVRSQH